MMFSYRSRPAKCPCGLEFLKTTATMLYCEACRPNRRKKLLRFEDYAPERKKLTPEQKNVQRFLRGLRPKQDE